MHKLVRDENDDIGVIITPDDTPFDIKRFFAYAKHSNDPLTLGRVMLSLFGKEDALKVPLNEHEKDIVFLLKGVSDD